MKYNLSGKIEMPKIERLANPEHKEEYKMPADYQRQAEQMLELIEARDKYQQIMPTLPIEARREAKPHYDKLCRSVDELEEKMAYEYERYQEERRREQELCEVTWREMMTEEHFIRVKHQRPHIFEEFAEQVTEGMTDAEREEHYRIIAKREADELEDILSGKTDAPEYENLYIKHRLPDAWAAELLLQITHDGFRTDRFFELNYDALERLENTRREYRFHLSDALPVRRRNMEEAILDMKKPLVAGWRFLLEYAEEKINSGKFKPLAEGYTQYLGDHIKSLENTVFWKYIIVKHTLPERLDEYIRIATEDFTTEEIEAFLKRAAECEEKDLDEMMHSLENERITTERVNARRGAADYKKIDGPELPERVKEDMQRSYQRRIKREEETAPGKIEHDVVAIFNRHLKTLNAVTDGGGYAPERYIDEQSLKDEEISEAHEKAMRSIEVLYVVFKHQKPEKLEEFHNIVTGYMLPHELEEFYERIRHLEETRLDEILGSK
jgi:hypothetical protein